MQDFKVCFEIKGCMITEAENHSEARKYIEDALKDRIDELEQALGTQINDDNIQITDVADEKGIIITKEFFDWCDKNA